MLHVFSAAFRCAICGQVAATVSLVPPTMPLPGRRRRRSDEPDPTDRVLAGRWRLDIRGGPTPVTFGVIADPAAVAAILDRSDVAALAAVNPEFANFRCPECPAVYCADHWSDIEPTYDEGFYDATYATCAKGHRILVDD